MIDKRIKYLNDRAPKGEFLAYINKKEAAMLKKAGGSGKHVNGIPSFRPQDMGNKSNQKASAANTGMGGSRKGPDKGTGGSKGNLGGGGGGQDSDYIKYSPPTKKTYTSKTIDSKPITGDDYRRSQNDFVNTLNKNNQIRAQQTGTKFTPYQGGARTTDYYNPNPLKNLFKAAASVAIPGAKFFLNQGSKLKDGIMSLNNRIQNTDFGRSTSLTDYLDMKKYGGYDEREMARQINKDEAKLLQARIDAGEFGGFDIQTPKAKPIFSDPFRNTVGTTTKVNAPASDAVSSYVPFSNYGKANAATLDGVPLNQALAPTPVEQLRDKAYTGIKENVGAPFSNFLNNLMNADQIAALENEYGSKYGITDTAGGISSDARHMAAMNNLSNSLSPFNNKFGNFIGDTGAFLAGAINEVPALFRGLGSKNLGEIGEDIAANFRGSFGTPNQTTAEQIYGDVFEGSTPARTASVPTYGTAAAAEVRPTIGVESTPFGSMPTGDVGLNASGRLGSLSATVDAIDALKGQSVDPQINYSGNFGNTTAYGNFSDDVQNLGLNFNNDKGLSGGISYDAITGEPRFDIGFRRTFADGGIASMFTRRG